VLLHSASHESNETVSKGTPQSRIEDKALSSELFYLSAPLQFCTLALKNN
jgi:hypothetical protein